MAGHTLFLRSRGSLLPAHSWATAPGPGSDPPARTANLPPDACPARGTPALAQGRQAHPRAGRGPQTPALLGNPILCCEPPVGARPGGRAGDGGHLGWHLSLAASQDDDRWGLLSRAAQHLPAVWWAWAPAAPWVGEGSHRPSLCQGCRALACPLQTSQHSSCLWASPHSPSRPPWTSRTTGKGGEAALPMLPPNPRPQGGGAGRACSVPTGSQSLSVGGGGALGLGVPRAGKDDGTKPPSLVCDSGKWGVGFEP